MSNLRSVLGTMAVLCSFGLILCLIRILVGKLVFVIDVCVVYGSPATRI